MECTTHLSEIMKVLKRESKSCQKTIKITYISTTPNSRNTTILYIEPTTAKYSTELLAGYINSLVCNINFLNEIKQRYHNSL